MTTGTPNLEISPRKAAAREGLGLPKVNTGESLSPVAQTVDKMRLHAKDKEWQQGMKTGGEHGKAQTRHRTNNAIMETTLQVEAMGYSYNDQGQKERQSEEKTNYDSAKQAAETTKTFLQSGYEGLNPSQKKELLGRVEAIIKERPAYAEEWVNLDGPGKLKLAESLLKQPELKVVVVEQLEQIKQEAPKADEMDQWTAKRNEALRTKQKLEADLTPAEQQLNDQKRQYDEKYSDLASATDGTDGFKLEELSESHDTDIQALRGYRQYEQQLQTELVKLQSNIDYLQGGPVPPKLQKDFQATEAALKDIQDRITPLRQNEKDYNRLRKHKTALEAKIRDAEIKYTENKTKVDSANGTIEEAERYIGTAKTLRDAREQLLADSLEHVIDYGVDELMERRTDTILTQWDTDLPLAEAELANDTLKQKIADREKVKVAMRKRYITVKPATEVETTKWLFWTVGEDGKPHLKEKHIEKKPRSKEWNKDQIEADYEQFFSDDETDLENTILGLYTAVGIQVPAVGSEDMDYAKAQMLSATMQARKLSSGQEPSDADREILMDKPWSETILQESVKQASVREALAKEGVDISAEDAEDLAKNNPGLKEKIRTLLKDKQKILVLLMVMAFGGTQVSTSLFTQDEAGPHQ